MNYRECFYCRKIKPILEWFLAFCGLILFWWVFALIAVLIFIDDPGPVVFRQKRIGRNRDGQQTVFWIRKFRTMKTTAPKDVPTHLLDDPEQYITRAGKFLRRFSLDELPQMWNIVVTRDLLLIGPRAALYNQDDLYEEREKYGANDVMPGITGWAQINGRDELAIPVKAKMDGEYAAAMRSNSFRAFAMDLRCFFGTFHKVLRSDGVVEGRTEK